MSIEEIIVKLEDEIISDIDEMSQIHEGEKMEIKSKIDELIDLLANASEKYGDSPEETQDEEEY